MTSKENLEKLLDFLSARIDPQKEQQKKLLYTAALNYQKVHRLPLVTTYPLDNHLPFEPYAIAEIYGDFRKMLFNELLYAFSMSPAYNHKIGDDLPLTVRVNFGTVVIASMAGASVEYLQESPPWVKPFSQRRDYVQMLDTPPEVIATQGLSKRVIEYYQQYRELLSNWKELKETIQLVYPDTQGPLDTAELLRGSELFIDFYQDPVTTQQILTHLAKVQTEFLKSLNPLISEKTRGFSHQHGVMIKGNILIRNDSAILISPQMYHSHVFAHDAFVLSEMNGGGFHACGKMDHLTDVIFQLPQLQCIDIGQSHLNDLDMIYKKAAALKIPVTRIIVSRESLKNASVLDQIPTGAVLRYNADSMNDAAKVFASYCSAADKRRVS